jgi:apolipoprotein N-acyltransferase
MPMVVPLLAAAVAGALLVLAYPPYGWAWIAVPAITLFLWAVRRAGREGRPWLTGFVFGATFFALLFPWLAELGVIALIPLVLAQAAFPAVFAGVVSKLEDPVAWFAGAVGGWALTEWIRVRFPLGGFAWGLLGYPAGEYDALRAASQWIGASGWSVVVVAVAAGLVLGLEYRSLRWPAIPVGVVIVLGVLGAAFPSVPDGREVRVAVVQGDNPCAGVSCPRSEVYASHLALTRMLEPGSVDLVVWPEGSTGFSADPILHPEIAEEMGSTAAELGTALLAGGDRPVSDTEWVNANVVFDDSGEIVDQYLKRHPVPFGEYVPARAIFGWIPELRRVPRDMVSGDGPVVFDVGFGPFGSVISFESSFARYSRDTVRAGADLLVVATSQVSYPRSNASDQLIGITRMRAAELGVDVVHGAVTGRSVIITDGGVLGERTPLAEPALITGTVHMRDAGPTLYTMAGDWLQMVSVLGAGAVLWIRRRQDPKRSS